MVLIPDSRMWGSEQVIFCPGVPLVPSAQIARIELDRPQTWAFLFSVNIPDVLSTPNVDVRFEVTAGLGRSAVLMALCRLRANTGGPRVFTTSAYTQGLIDPLDDTVKSELITYFPAQQIQLQAFVENAPSGGGNVYVSGYFAPLSHTPWDPGSGGGGGYQDLPWHGGGPDEQ
jgi:hypothetical protein